MENNIINKSMETDRYALHYMFNSRKKRYELRLKSKFGGKHRAIHSTFNLLDNDGNILETRQITPDVAEFIFNHFEKRGDTESFNIYQRDLQQQCSSEKWRQDIRPDSVLHQLNDAERTYTSTGSKLYSHWPIFKKYQDTGHGSIIRATMTNHQICSSHCHYCSTIARNRSDSVTLQEAKDFVSTLYFVQSTYNQENFPEYNALYKQITGTDIRLKGLILSGGGQPNLWPHFEAFVEWLSTLDIDVGLITNGFPKKIDEEIYNHFKWIRISITPEDASPHYVNGKFDQQYIPESIKHNPAVTVGYSYVYGPWTDQEIFNRICSSLEDNGFDYCRTLTDCNLTRQAQLRAHQQLAKQLLSMGLIDKDGMQKGKIFHQLKYHGMQDEAEELWDDGQCFLQLYNVFWDTTVHELYGHSYCYACDSITVLAEETTEGNVSVSERKFNSEKWGTVKNDEVEKLFTEPLKPYFDPRRICSSCLFMKNNRVVKELIQKNDFSDIKLNDNSEHINFP